MPPDLYAFLKEHRSVPILSVYDGRERVGTLVEVEGEHFAFGALDLPLGSFRRRQEAVAAIPALPTMGDAPVPSSGPGRR